MILKAKIVFNRDGYPRLFLSDFTDEEENWLKDCNELRLLKISEKSDFGSEELNDFRLDSMAFDLWETKKVGYEE